jgi:acetoin utilization protein AcuB
MFVAEWMTRDVLTVGPDEKISDVARVLARHRIRQLPVVEDRVLVGLMTKSDLLRACPPDLNPFSLVGTEAKELARPIRHVMTTELVTVAPDAPLERAAHILIDRRINALPVAKGRELVGILTGSDISRALLAALGAGNPGVRITFEVGGSEDVFASVAVLASKHRVRVRSVTAFEHQDRRTAVVRLDEEKAAFIEDLWKSGHRIDSVARFGDTPTAGKAGQDG